MRKLLIAAILLAAALTVSVGGETVASRFVASLRTAKPKAVTAASPGTPVGGRQLLSTIAGILADTTAGSLDEPDVVVTSADSASRISGTQVRLVGARHDAASITSLGAHQATLRVNRDQLHTLLVEGGRPSDVPPALNGDEVKLARPRGVRVEYGHCPSPIANTLQNQIQGPPPPSTDNGNCVILNEVPLATIAVPAGLDTASVMELALELAGMSPNQARDFRGLFDWRAAVSVGLPRGTRSYEIVNTAGTRGMLILSASRRDPTYTLLWTSDGIAYTLAGYGSSGDAASLAASVR